jgi:hypothetical protein
MEESEGRERDQQAKWRHRARVAKDFAILPRGLPDPELPFYLLSSLVLESTTEHSHLLSSPLRERPSWCASKLKSEAFAAPCQIDTRPNFPPHLPVHVEFLFVAVRRHAGGPGLSYTAARPVGVGHRRGRGFRHRDGERVRNRVGFEKSGGEVSCSRRRRIRSRTSTSSGRRPACHGRRRSRPGYGKGKEARQCFENFKGEPFFQSNPWPRSTPSSTR